MRNCNTCPFDTFGPGPSNYGQNDPIGIVEEELYVIIDHRKPWTDDALFWRSNRSGYTFQLDEAGLYTKEEAESIHRNRETDIPVPLSLAKKRVKQHVGREIVNEVLRKGKETNE